MIDGDDLDDYVLGHTMATTRSLPSPGMTRFMAGRATILSAAAPAMMCSTVSLGLTGCLAEQAAILLWPVLALMVSRAMPEPIYFVFTKGDGVDRVNDFDVAEDKLQFIGWARPTCKSVSRVWMSRLTTAAGASYCATQWPKRWISTIFCVSDRFVQNRMVACTRVGLEVTIYQDKSITGWVMLRQWA